MMPLRTSFQISPWFSITRGSDRNSLRYRRTARASGASGWPSVRSSGPSLRASAGARGCGAAVAAAAVMGEASFMPANIGDRVAPRESGALLGLDARELDDLAPLVGLVRNQPGEIGR